MTLQEYNKLIERFDKAFAADKWYQIDHFKVLYDELIEKRDAALKSKDAPEAPIIAQEPSKEEDTTTMLKDAQEAVKAFDAL